MHCPRCGHPLLEFEPSPRWQRYFRCEECWIDWHLDATQLVQGKKPGQIQAGERPQERR